MVIVPLTNRSVVAVIDNKDAARVLRYRWSLGNHGYPASCLGRKGGPNGKPVLLHRYLLGLKAGDGIRMDHANGDKLDNRRKNLRIATESQNAANGKLRTTNTTGYRGVSFHKIAGKFSAQITVSRKKVHLGLFISPIDAAKAYDAKAIELFGEFARPNFGGAQ